MSTKDIALDNDWRIKYSATTMNATTGAEGQVATGLTGLLGWLSATDKGATIHAALSVSLTEIGTTGIYTGVLQGDDLRTHLAALYTGIVVYEVVGDSLNVSTSIPRRIVAVRRP